MSRHAASPWGCSRLLVAVVLLTSCTISKPDGLTIEAALAQTFQEMSSLRTLTDPTVRLTRPVKGGVLALFTVEVDQFDQRSVMTSVWTVPGSTIAWRKSTGGASVRDAALPPIQYIVGFQDDHSFAAGMVTDVRVQQLAVTWADQRREVVPVENGAYFAITPGQQLVLGIDALDAQGTILYHGPNQ